MISDEILQRDPLYWVGKDFNYKGRIIRVNARIGPDKYEITWKKNKRELTEKVNNKSLEKLEKICG